MPLAYFLFVVGLAIAIPSLVFLTRLLQRMPSQRELFLASKPGKYINFLVTIPALIAFVLGSPSIRLIAAILLLIATILLTVYKRRWLRTHGAEPAFLKQLLVSSVGFGLAYIAFCGSLVIGL